MADLGRTAKPPTCSSLLLLSKERRVHKTVKGVRASCGENTACMTGVLTHHLHVDRAPGKALQEMGSIPGYIRANPV